MNVPMPERVGFMFAAKDVCHPYINIWVGGEHGKHAFSGTFTTAKPDVSRVCRYGENGEHRKLTNTHGANGWMIRKAVRR